MSTNRKVSSYTRRDVLRAATGFGVIAAANLPLSTDAQASFTGLVKPLDCANYTGTSADYGTSYTTLWRDSENGNMNYREGMGSHPGVDIARQSNGKSTNEQPVQAIYDGEVAQVYTGWGAGWGNCLVIKHTNIPDAGTIFSGYGHMNRFSESYMGGSKIKKGDTIGHVGNTGNSTGPHLHFQIDRDLGGVHPYFPNPVNQPDSNGKVLNQTLSPMKFVQDHESSSSVQYHLNLQTMGLYMTQEADGRINVNRPNPSMWELFTMTDLNGGSLNSYDKITIQSWEGWYLSARYDMGHLVFAEPQWGPGDWETYTLLKVVVSGNNYNAVPGTILPGDRIALQCSEGEILSARFDRTNYPLSCDRTYIGAWETLTTVFR